MSLIKIRFDINTTYPNPTAITIGARPSVFHWIEPPSDNRLSFRDEESSKQIITQMPEDPNRLKDAESLGSQIERIGSVLEVIGFLSIFMSFLSFGGPGSAILTVIRLFKVISR